MQALLVELLYRAGYFSSSAVDLHISSTWSPRPDAAGSLKRIERYPEELIDVVMEVWSDDQMDPLLKKCQRYEALGLRQIFVLSAEHRKIWAWQSAKLQPVTDVVPGHGNVIPGAVLWSEFEKRLHPQSASSD